MADLISELAYSNAFGVPQQVLPGQMTSSSVKQSTAYSRKGKRPKKEQIQDLKSHFCSSADYEVKWRQVC